MAIHSAGTREDAINGLTNDRAAADLHAQLEVSECQSNIPSAAYPPPALPKNHGFGVAAEYSDTGSSSSKSTFFSSDLSTSGKFKLWAENNDEVDDVQVGDHTKYCDPSRAPSSGSSIQTWNKLGKKGMNDMFPGALASIPFSVLFSSFVVVYLRLLYGPRWSFSWSFLHDVYVS